MFKGAKFDLILAAAVGFLLIFGLIMITSIGVPKSISLSAPGILYPSCTDEGVDCYLLFKKHLFRLSVALVVFLVAWRLPMRFWKAIAPALFIATIIALFLVYFIGSSYGTIAKAWIVIFNTSIQPSEFSKLAFVLYLAYWFSKKGNQVGDLKDGFIPFCIICVIMIIPIILQNDFGTTLLLTVIGAAMFFNAGAKLRHIGLGVLIAIMAVTVIISVSEHVEKRFKGFSTIAEDCIEDYCWQSRQANIAIGTGGFFGKGLTQGVQKSYWLPQATDDFIFAASAEELGFVRIIFVVLAYLVIAYRGFIIANNAKNSFEMLVATGLTTWIVFQAFINIAVNTALMPVTGITLPFISYGGSSLMACLAAIGILLHISQQTNSHESAIDRRGDRRARSTQPGRYRRA